MKMPTVNFDEHFAEYVSEWMKLHQNEYSNFDEMEEDMPRVYMNFLNTRAKWLGNVTPGAYFTQFEDPKVLVDWMNQYCEERVPLPEPLLEQITFVGKPCEKRLTALLKDEESEEEARMTAIELLREMDSTMPKMLYISWQLDREEKAAAAFKEAILRCQPAEPGHADMLSRAAALYKNLGGKVE